MITSPSRRRLLTLGSLGWLTLPLSMRHVHAQATQDAAPAGGVASLFPMQPSDMVKEMVGVSHGNVKRVRELVEAHPALARAAWDWGFGDWETALGAASHVGNREIAEFLISKGARPSLFSATMLGQLDVVKAFIAAQPGVQRIRGPHSITLLAHAKAGGEQSAPVLKYLETVGDADAMPEPPLAEEEMAKLAGVYGFGSGPTEQVEITLTRGRLMFTRKGMTPRALFHLGDRVFHPAGADAVRIRFSGPGGSGTTLTVHDPDVVLSARRA
jgi:hypothetical protein